MGLFSKKAQPKTEHPLTYPETLARVDEDVKARPVEFASDGSVIYPPQTLGGSVSALPISPYTGQPYDPAWGVRIGGGPRPKSDNPLLHRPQNPALDVIRRH
jgi:hypothetical protein